MSIPKLVQAEIDYAEARAAALNGTAPAGQPFAGIFPRTKQTNQRARNGEQPSQSAQADAKQTNQSAQNGQPDQSAEANGEHPSHNAQESADDSAKDAMPTSKTRVTRKPFAIFYAITVLTFLGCYLAVLPNLLCQSLPYTLGNGFLLVIAISFAGTILLAPLAFWRARRNNSKLEMLTAAVGLDCFVGWVGIANPSGFLTELLFGISILAFHVAAIASAVACSKLLAEVILARHN